MAADITKEGKDGRQQIQGQPKEAAPLATFYPGTSCSLSQFTPNPTQQEQTSSTYARGGGHRWNRKNGSLSTRPAKVPVMAVSPSSSLHHAKTAASRSPLCAGSASRASTTAWPLICWGRRLEDPFTHKLHLFSSNSPAGRIACNLTSSFISYLYVYLYVIPYQMISPTINSWYRVEYVHAKNFYIVTSSSTTSWWNGKIGNQVNIITLAGKEI
jgi:hypothetical protein